MAEYGKVIAIIQRIHNFAKHECSICPIRKFCKEGFTEKNAKEVEMFVLQWERENPKRTNRDVLKEIFPKIDPSISIRCPPIYGGGCPHEVDFDCNFCIDCWLNAEYKGANDT